MAEAILGVVTEGVLGKVVSLAAQEITLALGMKEELKKLAEKLEMIHALLSDAQSKQLTSRAVQLWLKKIQSIALDADILLDEFGYEILRQKIERRPHDKLRGFLSSSNPLSFRFRMAHKIKNVISSLEEAYKESDQIGLRVVELISTSPDLKEIRLTDPFVDDSEIVGRKDDVPKVISMLVSSDYKKDLPVIAIVGMAGQGKTTLAQLVYKNHEVARHFEKRIWLCVSDDFKVEKLLNEMLQPLTNTKFDLTNREAIVNGLKKHLGGKEFLLVLDDVWNENRDKWDCMRKCLLEIGGSNGSKIVATTRSDEVVSTMQASGVHQLGILSDAHSWELFENVAFAHGGATKTPELVDIGKNIVKRCGGVPLALKAIAGLLYSKNTEWEWLMIERSDIWSSSSTVDGVLSAIKLSYDHLPSLSLKQCFACCSIFPKDTLFKKENLIQIWMAQGLINPPKGSQLQKEDIGNNYFNVLLRSSLLQDPQKDLHNNIIHCKMHDLVHDFSLQVSKNYCFNMEDGEDVHIDMEAVHISLICREGKMIKNVEGISSKLRTLYLVGSAVLEDIFMNATNLYVLIVKHWDAKNLPNSIGKLKHLRHLDISETQIKRLPDSLTKLYNLETLRVPYLEQVPKGFGNLINLRHLYVSEDCLLPGIGRLTHLQTLPFFEVSKHKGCQIEELENLHNLRGKLKIGGLENVSSYESATKANLSRKSNIQRLELVFRYGGENERNDNDVIEGLKPHSNLKSLRLAGSLAPSFPSWLVTKNHLLLLRSLVEIRLELLTKWVQIPSLGDLPYLKIIKIDELQNVKCIGKEFYGWTNLDSARNNSCSSKDSEITLFPALRDLILTSMNSLVEWSDAIFPSQSSVKVFPYLERLRICSLSKLTVLPNMGALPCLRCLAIIDCQSLICLRDLNSLTSLQILEIHACPSLTRLSEDSGGLQGLMSLEVLLISSCPELVAIPDIHDLRSLRQLSINNCDKSSASLHSLHKCMQLESLNIRSQPGLWPNCQNPITSLRTLKLGGFSENLDYFPWPYSISSDASSALEDTENIQQHFVSLTTLRLLGWEKIVSLPEQIQYLSTLRELAISGFNGLEALPEWLGNFQRLQILELVNCGKLKELPSVETMQRLTNLQVLRIYGCPLLEERFTKASGADLPKISHIPSIERGYALDLLSWGGVQ